MEGGLKISYEKSKWWVAADARFVAKQNRVATSFGEVETPGFNIFNTRMGVKPFKGMILGLTVENILDTEYVEFLNWSFNKLIGEGLVREPGRNISLYFKYSL
jgi:iron complex outermembrane receptor protein